MAERARGGERFSSTGGDSADAPWLNVYILKIVAHGLHMISFLLADLKAPYLEEIVLITAFYASNLT